MNPIGEVTSRIAQIQSQLSALAPARPQVAATATAGTAAASRAGSLTAAGASVVAAGTPATFDQVMSGVLAAQQTSAPTTAVLPTAARVNADGVPVEFAGVYANGKVPVSALSTVEGTSAQLWAPAARAMEQMRTAAAREGVSIGITDSYRSYASQVDVARAKGLYKNGGLAAVPGTSMHGWGVATDLRLDGRALTWMRQHASEYGYVETTPRESWHWEFAPRS